MIFIIEPNYYYNNPRFNTEFDFGINNNLR